MKDVIKIGDEVSWRGSYGSDEPKTAKVESITLTDSPYSKHGEEAYSVKHSTLKGGKVVIDLSNGYWAYNTQIAPMGHDPNDWHKEI